MKNINKDTEVILAKNQLKLFGYKKYFEFFAKLIEKRMMPQSVLLTGPKGLGKATFVYHFSNNGLIFSVLNMVTPLSYLLISCFHNHKNFIKICFWINYMFFLRLIIFLVI